jgi:hypothetical protein
MELIRQNPRTAWRRYGDAMIVVTVDDRMVHKLSETGMAIWNAASGNGAKVAGIVSRMEQQFEAPHEEIDADVRELVRCLIDKKVLISETGGLA